MYLFVYFYKCIYQRIGGEPLLLMRWLKLVLEIGTTQLLARGIHVDYWMLRQLRFGEANTVNRSVREERVECGSSSLTLRVTNTWP